MKKLLLIISLLSFLDASSQRTEQINTELKTLFLDTLPSWNNLIKQAKAQNKFIYLYYTSSGYSTSGNTYETEFFPKTIKDYLTSKFILINLQVDHKIKNEFIYTKADIHFLDSLKNTQNISDRFVHLIFDKNGKPLTKFIYSFDDTLLRIKYLEEILEGKNQYYTLLNDFKKGNRQAEFIRNFYKAYQGATSSFYDDTIRIFRDFINAHPGKKLFNNANGQLIYDYSIMLYDECSRNLFLNKDEWYKILGKKIVDDKIIKMLYQDFQMRALIDYNYPINNRGFEKIKEVYSLKYIEYKEYFDAVFPKSKKQEIN